MQRVLPDGCADILFVGSEAPFVVGPATHTFMVSLPPEGIVTGVRFRPGAAAAMLGLPLDEILNREVELDAIWNRTAVSELTDSVLGGRTASGRLDALERALGIRATSVPMPDAGVLAAIAEIKRNPDVSQDELEKVAGYCARHLRRRFHEAVGYGVKTFQRIARLQRFRESSCRPEQHRHGLAGMAAHLGYADQAHMTREVKELSGVTPSNLRVIAPQMQTLSDPFSESP